MLLVPTLALLVADAGAYSYKTDEDGNELFWATSPIPVHFNAAEMQDVSKEEVRGALSGAIRDFDAADGSPLRFSMQGETPTRVIDWEDDVNVVFFTEDWAGLELDESLLAMTYTWYIDGGEIIGFDMAVNVANHEWSADGEPDLNDLHNTLTHELGHAAGLGHSEEPEASMFSTTFPGETTKRGLHADDVEGLAGLYGGMVFDSRLPLACASGGRGLGAAAPFTLSILGFAGLMRRRRGSDPRDDR